MKLSAPALALVFGSLMSAFADSAAAQGRDGASSGSSSASSQGFGSSGSGSSGSSSGSGIRPSTSGFTSGGGTSYSRFGLNANTATPVGVTSSSTSSQTGSSTQGSNSQMGAMGESMFSGATGGNASSSTGSTGRSSRSSRSQFGQPSQFGQSQFGRGQNFGGTSQRSSLRPAMRLGFASPTIAPAEISLAAERRLTASTGGSPTGTMNTAALASRPVLRGLQIAVDPAGIATLRGQATSAESARLAANMLRMEPGVKSVRNELTVAAE